MYTGRRRNPGAVPVGEEGVQGTQGPGALAGGQRQAREPYAPYAFTPDANFPVINTEKGRYSPKFTRQWAKETVLSQGAKGSRASRWSRAVMPLFPSSGREA